MTVQKVAVVTGGSAGIGAAAARALAQDGWHVVVAARRLDKCEAIAKEIGGVAAELDVTDQVSVDKLAAQLERVELVVNNAGGAKELDFLRDANDADWEWMFETNVMGTMRVTRALYPQLKASEGLVLSLIHISEPTRLRQLSRMPSSA